MPHPIENIMKTTMEQLKAIADVETVIGTPIMTDTGAMVLPVSKVSLGFLSGGGEYVGRSGEKPSSAIHRSGEELDGAKQQQSYPFAGTALAGMSVTPVGFLTVTDTAISMLPVNYNNATEKLVDMLPQGLSAIQKLFQNNKDHNDLQKDMGDASIGQ